MRNWISEDIGAGCLFLGVGLGLGGVTLARLPIGTAAVMGPGFFPLALCALLTVLGLGILLKAQPDAEPRPPVNWRALAFVTAAPVAFGLTVRSLGLLPALLISVALAVMATPRVGFSRGIAIVIGVTAFCIVVFKYGVRVPYDLIAPRLIY